MPLRTVGIGNGHELRDNGCNDYDFICPKKGRTGWYPPLVAMSFRLRKDITCHSCKAKLNFKNVKMEWQEMSKKKQPDDKRTCNQCYLDMDMATNDDNHYAVCTNPACPNYGLLQIAAEQMPKEST